MCLALHIKEDSLRKKNYFPANKQLHTSCFFMLDHHSTSSIFSALFYVIQLLNILNLAKHYTTQPRISDKLIQINNVKLYFYSFPDVSLKCSVFQPFWVHGTLKDQNLVVP